MVVGWLGRTGVLAQTPATDVALVLLRVSLRASLRSCWSSLVRACYHREEKGDIVTRITLRILTPPFRTKDVFINLRSNYFRMFTVWLKSFFRPFEPRPEERKKVNF